MSDLLTKHCKPCESGAPPMPRDRAQAMMAEIPGWSMNDMATEVSLTFRFKNYYETMAFVNALAFIAHREDHHPDLEVGYKRCRVRYSTHAIGGLSMNDFICAAKVNDLIGE
jgi:4a-hydroxytetrahydrobiopterin dehydratase